MMLTDVREQLLGQHAYIRSLIGQAVREGEGVRRGLPGSRLALRTVTLDLLEILDQHNADEERLLGDALRTIDAWGAYRQEWMTDHHRAEHVHMIEALRAACEASDPRVAAQLTEAALACLLAHMAQEEREILAEDVLRDDCVVVDSFGG